MPQSRLKTAARERMALTGENYTTALRRVKEIWDAQDAALTPDAPKPLATDRPVLTTAEYATLTEGTGI